MMYQNIFLICGNLVMVDDQELTLDLTDLHGVRVTVALDGSSVNVSVSDSGAGDALARQWQQQLDQLLEDERSFGRNDDADTTNADADSTTQPTAPAPAPAGLRI